MLDSGTMDFDPPSRFQKLWVLWMAARPSQIALVLLVYVLGIGVAIVGSPFSSGAADQVGPATVLAPEFIRPVILGGIALIPITVTVHYANEYADVETDAITERTPFSGGSGALVRTGLPRSFLRSATFAAVLVSLGVLVVVIRIFNLSTDAAALLLMILGGGLAYSLPPAAFVRRGVGELVNGVLGGLLLPLYGIAVVGEPKSVAVVVFLPFSLLVGCNLFATHWPDRHADETVGKRTLAVRWSARGVRQGYTVLAVIAGVITVGLSLLGLFPTTVAVAHLIPIPFLAWGWRVLTKQRSPLPAVLAMVSLAVSATAAWWWVGLS
jgi:1,4-dihydroxy-2-naphthoate octaprenyltransferase